VKFAKRCKQNTNDIIISDVSKQIFAKRTLTCSDM